MKDKIITKGTEMFLSHGFKTVTMDDIANEMGISKKTIYKYFNNKEHLVDETTTCIQQTIDGIISSIMEKNYNAIEENFVIKSIFKDLFKNAKTSPMFQLKKYYPETYTKLMEREFCSFSECVKSNLQKGIDEKLYRPDIDIDMVMKFYFTLVFGAYESDLFAKEVKEIIKIEIDILEYHTRAIATLYGFTILEKELEKNKEN